MLQRRLSAHFFLRVTMARASRAVGILTLVVSLGLPAGASGQDLPEILYVSGCYNDQLVVPVVGLWDSTRRETVVSYLAGGDVWVEGGECKGAVVRTLSRGDQDSAAEFVRVQSVVNGDVGWLESRYTGAAFPVTECDSTFLVGTHHARCIAKTSHAIFPEDSLRWTLVEPEISETTEKDAGVEIAVLHVFSHYLFDRHLYYVIEAVNDWIRVPPEVSLQIDPNCDSFSETATTGSVARVCLGIWEDLLGFTRESCNGGGLCIGSEFTWSASTLGFLIAHELGHALIYALDIPQLGNEEEAADRFAALLFLRTGAVDAANLNRETFPLGAMAFFATLHDQSGDELARYGASHPLEAQRMADLTCWLIARRPDLGDQGSSIHSLLPADRLDNCQAEFLNMEAAWTRVLGEVIRVPSAGSEEAEQSG